MTQTMTFTQRLRDILGFQSTKEEQDQSTDEPTRSVDDDFEHGWKLNARSC